MIAIVMGLLMGVGAASVVTVAVAFIGLRMTGAIDGTELASDPDADEATHIIDTDQPVPEIDLVQRPARGGGRSAPEPEPEAPRAQPAPVILMVPPNVLFHEVEVSCPNGFRSRAKFQGSTATVAAVPPEMVCTANFKGSQPGQTKVRAGETLSCTFSPTNCQRR